MAKLAEKTVQLLDENRLKKTPLRVALLEYFLGRHEPSSQADLLLALGKKMDDVDRVSVYRNLQQFITVGLIHEVEKNSYVSCAHECSNHPHILLFCNSCQRHEEIHDHTCVEKLISTLKDLKFFGFTGPIHLKGSCSECQKS